MTTKQFLRRLQQASDDGYVFKLFTGVNLGPDGEKLPKRMLRCTHAPDGPMRWVCLPIEAVHHHVEGEMARGHVDWVIARRNLGLTAEQGAIILRAGDQIVSYEKGATEPHVKHSRRLRRDMLAACNIEE